MDDPATREPGPPEPPGPPGRRNRADVFVRVGAVLFAIGLVATAVIIIPFFFGATERPTWLNVVAAGGLTIGFALALIGIVAAVLSPPAEDDTEPVDTEGNPI
ncbi:hypothetical protein [Protofrankia symbiont of Coriaria ruscifolia]|uniref:hypothetical protein n=1 Tax=Protofrankia symbiont of Coriaria ruscifolia TaxID=1306542 RepID=UPI000A3E076C|nr:hypothetical protein [Protofrankia symbiont of Coriaria ruscifolia]